MKVIRGIEQLKEFLSTEDCSKGCLADTGFLYATSFLDDRVYQKAVETFDLLADFKVLININVVSRMEFIDLVFRKQITIGAVETFQRMSLTPYNKELFNLLKNIRDQDVAHKRQNKSYKISDTRLKDLREAIETTLGPDEWREFCSKHSGDMLCNEWKMLEEDLGLNFVEVLEGQTSDIVIKPLHWHDMVGVMGKHGIRGPDAMISNLFLKSCLRLLITTDLDIVKALDEDDPEHENKFLFYLT